ncbi:hypothetical protein [Limosilactobacillus mucosae]|uniref:DUF5011 domain-containing protein n=1 Tax=Limosilactobacillus mucosae TaxID=97478 RepID=A0AAJ1HTW9_LIMMU|nr:hypothetical protein [Limosilactobacillus mucosae]MDC2828480.1 hypothetical protein [Limosilactobacillus mucosae]MDC2834378.1 hypothetical protein [Limosilactobacillus mucosae]
MSDNPIIKIGNRDVYVEETNAEKPYDLVQIANITAISPDIAIEQDLKSIADQLEGSTHNSTDIAIKPTIAVNERRIDYSMPGIYKVAVSAMDANGNIAIDYLQVHVLSPKDVRRVEAGKEPLEKEFAKEERRQKGNKRQQRKRQRQIKQAANPKPEKNRNERGKSKRKNKRLVIFLILLQLVIIAGTLLFFHTINNSKPAESFHDVEVNDSLSTYNKEANTLINQLEMATEAYEKNNNKTMFYKSVGVVQSDNYSLQMSLSYRKKHGKGYLTLENKLQKLANTAQVMQTVKSPQKATKVYQKAYGGMNKISMIVDDMVLSN